MSDMADALAKAISENRTVRIPAPEGEHGSSVGFRSAEDLADICAAALSAAGFGPVQGIKHEAWDGGYRAGWADRTRSLMERRTYEEEVAKATPNPWPSTG